MQVIGGAVWILIVIPSTLFCPMLLGVTFFSVQLSLVRSRSHTPCTETKQFEDLRYNQQVVHGEIGSRRSGRR